MRFQNCGVAGHQIGGQRRIGVPQREGGAAHDRGRTQRDAMKPLVEAHRFGIKESFGPERAVGHVDLGFVGVDQRLQPAVERVRAGAGKRHHEALTGGVHGGVGVLERVFFQLEQHVDQDAGARFRACRGPAGHRLARRHNKGVRGAARVIDTQRFARIGGDFRFAHPPGFAGLVEFERLSKPSLIARKTLARRVFAVKLLRWAFLEGAELIAHPHRFDGGVEHLALLGAEFGGCGVHGGSPVGFDGAIAPVHADGIVIEATNARCAGEAGQGKRMDIAVAGIGWTALGKHETRSVKDLVAEAVAAALADAVLPAERIEAALFANTRQPILEGQNAVRGQIALAPLGIGAIPIVDVENACASGSSAVALGADMIRAGRAQSVLVVGAEKMVYRDRDDLVMKAFRGGTDIEAIEETAARMAALGAELIPADHEPATRRSFFMDIYGGLARAHMARFGTTCEQIAAAAAKNHANAALNPRAQYGGELSVEAVLRERPIIWPLTRPMCAPISDGAAALVLRPARAAGARGVRLAGIGWTSASAREAEDYDRHLGRRAALAAYDAAGIGPEDVNLAEVHDATSFAELLQIENLGLCPRGEGGAFTASGATARGGRVPVNVSGGLVAKGHPVGATGVIQLCELVEQLRGEAGGLQIDGARVAVAENGGGFLGIEEAATVVTVLQR